MNDRYMGPHSMKKTQSQRSENFTSIINHTGNIPTTLLIYLVTYVLRIVSYIRIILYDRIARMIHLYIIMTL